MIFFLFYSRKGKIFSFRAFGLLKNMPKLGAMTVPAFKSTKGQRQNGVTETTD
jgi:hypothetical protein